MKIQQVNRYHTPEYPTLEETRCDAHLLERLPHRWMSARPFASLAGMGLLTKALMAHAEPSPVAAPAETMQTPINQAPSPAHKQTAVKQTKRIATAVAPLLSEALEHDGRGTFGCVANNPPCFLSENEALELIQSELEKAGLKLRDGMTVEGLEAPVKMKPDTKRSQREPTLGTTHYEFDLGDPEKSVAIEFFSIRDHDLWMGGPWSTAPSYDFPELMELVSESFKKRDTGKPMMIGLFFDPLASRWHGVARNPNTRGLTEAQRQFMQEQTNKRDWQNELEISREVARAKLRKQVLHFVDYLKREGVLPQE